MFPTQQGSIPLFKVRGISVHVHWSWLVVAFYSISTRLPKYDAWVWAVWEYLTLFGVVLLHEFGHALACRQVGGQADQIILWPLGGVAYVAPPSRPGATLWSIAAGPLVNVVLVPVFFGMQVLADSSRIFDHEPNALQFLHAINAMNLSLLVFNLLPVYPLDGGQILRSLLWYPLGRARSLLVATVVGCLGGVGLIVVSWRQRSWWLALVAYFLLSNCWHSFQHARKLRRIERLPRREGFKCPACHASPPAGNYWRCTSCRQPFDPFATAGKCPHCAAVLDLTACVDCGSAHALPAWDASIRDI